MDSLPQNNPSREISALWDFWDELQPCRSQPSLSSAGICFQLQVEQGCCGRLSPAVPPQIQHPLDPTPGKSHPWIPNVPMEPPGQKDRGQEPWCHQDLGRFCKGLDFGRSQCHEGMQVWSIFPTAAGKFWAFLEKSSRSRVDFHALRGRIWKPGRENCNPGGAGRKSWMQSHPPHFQEGNWEDAEWK